MEVGEGSTSVNLDGGSFRDSLVQIALGHGNDPGPRVELPCACDPQVPDSAEGVLGWDAVGDIVLEANDPFLG
jgi:hypothetical protein